MKLLIILSICVVLFCVEAFPGKGGGFGRGSSGGSRGRGSSSSSSSGGWFGGSKSSTSNTASKSSSSNYGWSDNIHKSPSTSYTAPKASLPATNTGSYGWNVNGQNGGIQKQTNTGLNAGNTGSYGWNVNGVNGGVQKQTNTGLNAGNTQAGWNIGQGAQKPISPVGPPPAYPGMGHHPVASHSQPPAYSPSHVNPPAYSPSHNNPYGSATNTHYNQQYGQNQNNHQFGGSSFSNGGAYNGFGHHPVVNNYYGSQQSRGGFGSNLMTNAMFYGIGMHHGHSWGSNSRRHWSDDDDRRWRATTKAPYFENKVPGSQNVLPAAAVLGAASVFGLASLLPLRVPIGKPLLSCNETYLNQTDIRLDGSLYECVNGTILVSCLEQILSSENNTNTAVCTNGTLTCDLENPQTNCSNTTLSFQTDIFCNSTLYVNVRNATELHCFFGTLEDSEVVYIPTANPLDFTTMKTVTTTEQPLITRMANFVYSHILWGLGKSEMPKQSTTQESITEKLPTIVEDTKNIPSLVLNTENFEQTFSDIPPFTAMRLDEMKLNDLESLLLTEEQKFVESHKIIEEKLAEIQKTDLKTDFDTGNDDRKKMSKMFQ